jgi:uncharacterized protein (DUF1810 family)
VLSTASSTTPDEPASADDRLARFLAAQAGAIDGAIAELRSGPKVGHWMWFVFPQLAGLGRSEISRFYAIESLDEARAYLDHRVLGARLREAARAVLSPAGRDAEAILGPIDAVKLRSSMTLFHRAAPTEPLFVEVLDRFYGGQADDATDELLAGSIATRGLADERPPNEGSTHRQSSEAKGWRCIEHSIRPPNERVGPPAGGFGGRLLRGRQRLTEERGSAEGSPVAADL